MLDRILNSPKIGKLIVIAISIALLSFAAYAADPPSNAVTINFDNATATVNNPFPSEVNISQNGAHIVVRSARSGVNYVLTGASANGSFKVYGDIPFNLYLNGVSLTNSSGAAVNIQSDAEANVYLVDQTVNRLNDGTAYTVPEGENMSGTLFSESMLIFDGAGSLIISSRTHNAISNLGDINIKGGSFDISVSGEAAKGIWSAGNINVANADIDIATTGNAAFMEDVAEIVTAAGIRAFGDMVVDSGSIDITSSGVAGMGIHVDGEFVFNDGDLTIVTTGDQYVVRHGYSTYDAAAQGVESLGDLTVNGGRINIKATGTDTEGLESKATLYIKGGLIELDTADDAINAADHIDISGGMISAYSHANDGIDSNGTITISGGIVIARGTSATPDGGIDNDRARFEISGDAIVIGIGGRGSSTPTDGNNAVMYNVGTTPAGTAIRIERHDGREILTFVAPTSFTHMLFSTPALSHGDYVMRMGGTVSSGTNFYGYHTGAGYSGGTSTNFTVNNRVTNITR